MKAPRVVKVKSSLSEQMSRPGGRSVRSALEKAEVALATHKELAMEDVRGSLAELEKICATQAPGSHTRIYDVAAELLDIAGFFKTGPLYTATNSLCDVAEYMDQETWDWQAVAVHLSAMRLFLNDDCRDSDMANTMVDGLLEVTALKARSSNLD